MENKRSTEREAAKGRRERWQVGIANFSLLLYAVIKKRQAGER